MLEEESGSPRVAAAGRGVGERNSASAYDFVKIRVWLGEGHSYVLSRFLVSRTLTASLINFDVAVKVSLEVKKALVDSDMLEVTQAQLEETIFRFLRQRQLGEEVVGHFRLLNSFHQRRQPLLVLICGSSLSFKSTIATQLAERLNFSNVLNTDWVHRLLTHHAEAAGKSSAESLEEWVAVYEADSRAVSAGLSSDLQKCLRDGKALVVEGVHCHLVRHTTQSCCVFSLTPTCRPSGYCASTYPKSRSQPRATGPHPSYCPSSSKPSARDR